MDITHLVQALGERGGAWGITALLLMAILTKVLTSREFVTLFITRVALYSRQKERQDRAMEILHLREGHAPERPLTDHDP